MGSNRVRLMLIVLKLIQAMLYLINRISSRQSTIVIRPGHPKNTTMAMILTGEFL